MSDIQSREKENFQFRISQIAALALIVSVISVTIAFINFVGLSPVVQDLDKRIIEMQTSLRKDVTAQMEQKVAAEVEIALRAERASMQAREAEMREVQVRQALSSIDGAASNLNDDQRAHVAALKDQLATLLITGAPQETDELSLEVGE